MVIIMVFQSDVLKINVMKRLIYLSVLFLFLSLNSYCQYYDTIYLKTGEIIGCNFQRITKSELVYKILGNDKKVGYESTPLESIKEIRTSEGFYIEKFTKYTGIQLSNTKTNKPQDKKIYSSSGITGISSGTELIKAGNNLLSAVAVVVIGGVVSGVLIGTGLIIPGTIISIASGLTGIGLTISGYTHIKKAGIALNSTQ